MVPFNKILAVLALGLAVAAGVSPALARGRADYAGGATRAAALRACTATESKNLEYLWGVSTIEIYRSCMAEHGQME